MPKNIGTFQKGKHGGIDSFFIRLARYGSLGWMLFFLTLLLFMVMVIVRWLTPDPVMVVDKHGNFLGRVAFTNSIAKTDKEILGAAEKFAMCYWSLNAPTIDIDAACAIQMMDTEPFHPSKDYKRAPMRERRLNDLKNSSFISVIKEAQNRTSVEFDDDLRVVDTHSLPVFSADGQQVFDEDGSPLKRHYKRVVISGEIQALGTKKTIRKFKQELMMRLVPRTSFDHTGVLISDINDI